MDASKYKALADVIDLLTTSGEAKLDVDKMKEVKKICRTSDDYVSHCFELVWSQLKRDHAEIRLSSFQVINELFRRSHKFRVLLLDNFQSYLELTLEIDLDNPLPPPKKAAETLKNSAYQALKEWHEAYSSGYRKLELAYNYLRSCHQVDFNKADHINALQRQREREAELHAEAQRNKKIEKVLQQINENEDDIVGYATQLNTCFKLLLPSQHVFDAFDDSLFSSNSLADNQVKSNDVTADHSGDMQEHGMLNHKSNITIDLSKGSIVVESEENTDIIHNLDELKVLLTMKYQPMIVMWLQVLQKNGAKQEVITRAIDIKQKVYKVLSDLDVLTIHRLHGSDSEEDDDMIEVPEQIDEVAFLKSRLNMSGIPSTSKNQPSTSKDLKYSAPVVEYDLDLEYWENPEAFKIPEVTVNDASRFWIPSDRSYSFHSSLEELYSSRKIDFSGKFVPVKWACRAPLGNGRLCPRMDRVKCPFHGVIVARNEDGSPANQADAEKLERIKEKQRRENPEWQDPALLADIESQTGINLKVTKQKKTVKRKSKLTNINKVPKTARDRLESKILSRKAMKRVASAMNTLDQKRLKDKFCHSFTATFAK